MSEADVLPELKEIVGAVLFAAKQPVTVPQLRKLLKQTAEKYGEVTKDFALATEKQILEAVEALRDEMKTGRPGFQIVALGDGYRLENVPRCGPWLREYLEKGKAQRLSQPALETLAIVAYRQPCVRSQIEAVRGVAVDQILRNLLEMQLIKIVGRSDLPGRPWLFGTTQKFIEYFGLRSLDELPGVEELRRFDAPAGPNEARKVEPGELALNETEPPPPAFSAEAQADWEAPIDEDLPEEPAGETAPGEAEDTGGPDEAEDEGGDVEDEEDSDEEEFDEEDDDFDEDDEDDEDDEEEGDDLDEDFDSDSPGKEG